MHYRVRLARYAAAVRDALGSEPAPELWFWDVDAVVVVDVVVGSDPTK